MSAIQTAIDTFRRAAELNLSDPLRHGSLLCFANYGQVVMTGDLHGHRKNFEKLIRYCQLEATPVRHVILHELMHEEPESLEASDHSVELLLSAAQWKTFFPEQIHFLQSNHELAQLQDHQISKGGRTVTEDFDRGVAEVFGSSQIDGVLEAIDEFVRSLPLAGRTPNRIFFAHSLPDASDLPNFDPGCVDCPAEEIDYSDGSSAYKLVWGRRHTPELLDKLATAYGVDFFVIGHQPQEFGYNVQHDRLIVLASDHNHGVFLPIDCARKYDIEGLVSRIRPFAGVA